MTSAATTTRERVRQVVASDLRPVTPIFTPARRVLIAVPIAAAVTYLAASRYGRRADFEQLGALLTWGLSGLQWMLGLLVLGVAFRLAVPGCGASRRALWTIGGATIAWILTITAVTYAAHATFVPPRAVWMFSYLCFIGPIEAALPLLAVATLLTARAYPTRPATAGAFGGLAAGIVSDSGWRLTCWVTAPIHVLGSHALAVAALAASGAALGIAIDRARARLRRS